MRTDRYKYIHYPHGDGSPDRHLAELYDLKADPDETTNLIAKPEHAQTIAELQQELSRLMAAADALARQDAARRRHQVGAAAHRRSAETQSHDNRSLTLLGPVSGVTMSTCAFWTSESTFEVRSAKHGSLRSSHRSQRSAFTLVELLVVIAIIGVLVALLSARRASRPRGLAPFELLPTTCGSSAWRH